MVKLDVLKVYLAYSEAGIVVGLLAILSLDLLIKFFLQKRVLSINTQRAPETHRKAPVENWKHVPGVEKITDLP